MSALHAGADFAKPFVLQLIEQAKKSDNPEEFYSGALTMLAGGMSADVGGLKAAALFKQTSATAVAGVLAGVRA